jgi:hypothetical protein
MILYCNGDSNTYGSEIMPPGFALAWPSLVITPSPDAADLRQIDIYRHTKAWPGVLGQHLGATIINDAAPGGSNQRIVRTTLEWLARNHGTIRQKPEEVVVVIGFTESCRYEFHDDAAGRWTSIGPNFVHFPESLLKAYYGRFHSDKASEIGFWQDIIHLQTLLDRLGVRHLFFASYRPLGRSLTPDIAGYLRPLISDSGLLSDTSMHHACFAAGCRKAPGHHFLEDGHALWADVLRAHLNKQQVNNK